MRCTGMHVICLCYSCTIYSTHPASSKASKRVNEQTEPGRADRTWTNGRTNQPTWTNQRTNEPTWNETNQRICNTQAQHNTAQPYEATAVPLPLHMKQKKFPSLRTPRLRLPSHPLLRLPLTAYAYPSRKRRGEGGTCDCATVRKYCMTMRCPWPYTRLKCINNCA